MNGAEHASGFGPVRDFVGYGQRPPDPQWPDEALIVVNVVLNYEEGAEFNVLDDGENDSWGEYEAHLPPERRDLGTESHMEFGSRVGVWRLCRLFEQLEVPFTVNACGRALERNPAFSAWLKDAACDIMGHGYRWEGPDSPGAPLSREREAEQIAATVTSTLRMTGRRPAGWNVRSFPSVHTRELVAAEGGFVYDSDAYNDEVPYYAATSSGPFLVVPYTQLHNDTRYFVPPAYSSPRDFVDNLRLALDFLIDEATRTGRGRLMSVGLHARWSGQPSRAWAVAEFLRYAREARHVKLMRRVDVARHWRSVHPPPER
jgi:peptidoglycan/xylan/chitin deacetylase (PgdA/CDA1 family)